MSVYNGGKYMQQAVDGILAQTFTDFELVIIDDASIDETPQILDTYQDARIVLIKNGQNMGLAWSLNRAISVSHGEFIARQDADDWSYPYRLERQIAILDAEPTIGAVGTAAEWLDDSGDILQVWPPAADNANIQETLLRYCCLIHGSTMYRRRAIHELGGYNADMRTGQDYDLWLRMSETWDLANLQDVLYVFRQHEGAASVRCREEQMRNAGLALAWAIRRRLRYAGLALGIERDRVPPRLRRMSRRWLAQRYAWWSAGARELSRKVALQFLLIALLFDPTTPEIWSYVYDIVMRKSGIVNR